MFHFISTGINHSLDFQNQLLGYENDFVKKTQTKAYIIP